MLNFRNVLVVVADHASWLSLRLTGQHACLSPRRPGFKPCLNATLQSASRCATYWMVIHFIWWCFTDCIQVGQTDMEAIFPVPSVLFGFANIFVVDDNFFHAQCEHT